MKQAFGAIHSPLDYRDKFAIASFVPTLSTLVLPSVFDTHLAPPMMQAKEPACVSHSVVDTLKLYWFRKTGKWIDFSPRFLDILAKRFDGQPIDGGTIPRLVFKLAVNYGCATTATIPNDTTLPIMDYRNDAMLTPSVFAEAALYKIPGYVNVPIDLVSIRQAIYFYGAVSTLFSVGSELWLPSYSDKDIDPLRTPAQIISGHQMTPKGWVSPTMNKLRNEWSAAWANQGESLYDAVQWAPYVHEAWSVAEIPQDVQNFLSILPKASDFHYTWSKNLAYGDTGDDVKFLQIALMTLGYININPQDLGIYGPKTAAGVSQYQALKGIYPLAPNNVGPRTRNYLNSQFSL